MEHGPDADLLPNQAPLALLALNPCPPALPCPPSRSPYQLLLIHSFSCEATMEASCSMLVNTVLHQGCNAVVQAEPCLTGQG